MEYGLWNLIHIIILAVNNSKEDCMIHRLTLQRNKQDPNCLSNPKSQLWIHMYFHQLQKKTPNSPPKIILISTVRLIMRTSPLLWHYLPLLTLLLFSQCFMTEVVGWSMVLPVFWDRRSWCRRNRIEAPLFLKTHVGAVTMDPVAQDDGLFPMAILYLEVDCCLLQ